MFKELGRISARPAPFSDYTTAQLWNDPHVSARMLDFHLDGDIDVSSRTTTFITRSLDWITATFDVGDHTRLLDLGCGPGLYTNPLARTGASVTGVDFSERSLGHARQAARDSGVVVHYVLGDYLDAPIEGSFDLITLIMCDFCALGPMQRQRLLARVASWLADDGRFVFDVYSYAAFDVREESITFAPNLMEGFWSPDPYFGFLHVYKYPEEHVVLDRYDIIGAERTVTSYNWLQHYDVETITSELAAAGLEVETVLGDVAGSAFDAAASESAVVARPDTPG